jgi:hypothetical protein
VWSGPCCCAFRSVPSPRRGLGILRARKTFVQQRAQLAGSRIRQVPELRRPCGRFRLAHSSRGPRNRRMVARPPWPTPHYLSMVALAPCSLAAPLRRRSPSSRPPSLKPILCPAERKERRWSTRTVWSAWSAYSFPAAVNRCGKRNPPREMGAWQAAVDNSPML